MDKLPNNNESATVPFHQKFRQLNKAQAQKSQTQRPVHFFWDFGPGQAELEKVQLFWAQKIHATTIQRVKLVRLGLPTHL